MITIQNTELRIGFKEAIERARRLSTPVLVSEVQKVKPVNPLRFFSAGKEKYVGERFFWKDPTEDMFLIGLGTCFAIKSDQAADRFFHVEKEWKNLLDQAVILHEESISATGPIMFGGFSFDPLKPKTTLWEQYPHTIFHIPRYLVTVTKGGCYVTTNLMCTGKEDDEWFSQVITERNELLSLHSDTATSQAALLSIEEVQAAEWKQSVTNLIEQLQKGELKKAVLARELRLRFSKHVAVEPVLDHLLKEQHESFVFAFESNGDCFVGASPERLVKKSGASLFSTCLAGSIARGKSFEEDHELGNTLLSDDKNLIEHKYVVDMIKEAMSQVCQNVTIPSAPQLLKMKHIQHLYTPVVGNGDQNSSLLQLVDLLHPTPALGGLPKKEAVETIRSMEALDRGMYAAPIGWVDHKHNGEFAVAIRSGLIKGKEVSLFAGCGVVKDSDVESEYQETNIKFRPMLTALKGEMG